MLDQASRLGLDGWMKFQKLRALIWVSLVISALNALAQPADLVKQLDEIAILLKPSAADTEAAKNVKAALAPYPNTFRSLIAKDQLGSVADYGNRDGFGDLTAVPQLSERLAEFLRAVKVEVAGREQAKVSEGEALMTRVGTQLVNAKKAEDLDELMQALSNTKVSEYENSPTLATLSRKLQGALRIVACWQEYLIAKEVGDVEQSRSSMQQISSQLSSTPIFPRSIALRLLNPTLATTEASEPKGTNPRIAAEDIINQLIETGDSELALEQFKSVPKASLNGTYEASMPQQLLSVETVRKLEPSMAESEALANVRMLYQNNLSINRMAFTRAVDQIALNAVSRSYGLGKLSAKTTSTSQVLDKFAKEARLAEDWVKLRRVITSLDSLNYGSSIDNQKRNYDLTNISYLISAQVAMEHNDLEGAITAYTSATSYDGLYIPRETAYIKLADLKQKFPDKIAPILAKAEESRQRADAFRTAAMFSTRDARNGMSGPRMSEDEMKRFRPMIEEIIAGFLKEKRIEEAPAEMEPAKQSKVPKKN